MKWIDLGSDTVNIFMSGPRICWAMKPHFFVPTGTNGNLIALKAHTQSGEEVILETGSHIYNSEMGLSAFRGLVAWPACGDANGI
jgi:threonine aldolase